MMSSLIVKGSKILITTLLLLMVTGCSPKKSLGTIEIKEQHGLDRKLAYVSAEISSVPLLKNSEGLIALDTETGKSIPVQVINTFNYKGKSKSTLLFPVAIKANTSRSFELVISDKTTDEVVKDFQLSTDGLSVENKDYKILFSTKYDQRGGQIDGIVLKNFKDQVLRRGHISMHWAPNFSRPDSRGYYNFEHLNSSSQNDISTGIYQIVKDRSGATDSIPEIDLKGRYTFYKGLPYFTFESSMFMKEDLSLDLLRNDEMTMDSLFTHVIYRTKEGNTSSLQLYDPELDVLEEHPIPDDASYVAFYHKEKGYGLGSIRLEYDNTNLSGNPSPTNHPYTKISKSSGNGRYWNRILTDTLQEFPKGSQYKEKNAYFIFKVDEENPEKEVLYYQERLLNPLVVNLK